MILVACVYLSALFILESDSLREREREKKKNIYKKEEKEQKEKNA